MDLFESDDAILRSFGGDTADANARARALATAVRDAAFAEVLDVAPAARSVLVSLRDQTEPSDALRALMATDPPPAPATGRAHTIGVAFDGEDLDAIARAAGMSADALVVAFCEPTYVAAFVGFSPGFPYLLGLPRALGLPRRGTPRTRVPAGSVAVAGGWAGIYPSETPGGWHLLGTTSATMFDPSMQPPSLVNAGDTVRFTVA